MQALWWMAPGNGEICSNPGSWPSGSLIALIQEHRHSVAGLPNPSREPRNLDLPMKAPNSTMLAHFFFSRWEMALTSIHLGATFGHFEIFSSKKFLNLLTLFLSEDRKVGHPSVTWWSESQMCSSWTIAALSLVAGYFYSTADTIQHAESTEYTGHTPGLFQCCALNGISRKVVTECGHFLQEVHIGISTFQCWSSFLRI